MPDMGMDVLKMNIIFSPDVKPLKPELIPETWYMFRKQYIRRPFPAFHLNVYR